MSRYALAKALKITPARLGEIIRGKRAITPDTALRLARYFGTSGGVLDRHAGAVRSGARA
jgi:addiction module HigA family antidote